MLTVPSRTIDPLVSLFQHPARADRRQTATAECLLPGVTGAGDDRDTTCGASISRASQQREDGDWHYLNACAFRFDSPQENPIRLMDFVLTREDYVFSKPDPGSQPLGASADGCLVWRTRSVDCKQQSRLALTALWSTMRLLRVTISPAQPHIGFDRKT
jgi:hypothetical protein